MFDLDFGETCSLLQGCVYFDSFEISDFIVDGAGCLLLIYLSIIQKLKGFEAARAAQPPPKGRKAEEAPRTVIGSEAETEPACAAFAALEG